MTDPNYNSSAQTDDSDSDVDLTQPVGNGGYTVRRGDDMSKIADAHGFFWETLWNHAENSAIKAERKNPNILLAGDKVFIPELRRKDESCGDQEKHRFRRKGVPSKITLVLRRFGEPRAGVDFEFDADGKVTTGTTDADGKLEASVPPDCTRGILTLKGEGREEKQTISIGQLDPVLIIGGVQQRLANLNYPCNKTDKLDDQTRDAVRAFQQDNDLDASGNPDQQTRDKLVEVHGC